MLCRIQRSIHRLIPHSQNLAHKFGDFVQIDVAIAPSMTWL